MRHIKLAPSSQLLTTAPNTRFALTPLSPPPQWGIWFTRAQNIRHLPVVTETGDCVGMLSMRDLAMVWVWNLACGGARCFNQCPTNTGRTRDCAARLFSSPIPFCLVTLGEYTEPVASCCVRVFCALIPRTSAHPPSHSQLPYDMMLANRAEPVPSCCACVRALIFPRTDMGFLFTRAGADAARGRGGGEPG